MLSCMEDSAHDKEHIYRVLYTALDIAQTEQAVDYDVLICSCLLHDIGRREQLENTNLCHAQVGAEKAYCFLSTNSFPAQFSEHVRQCILTHRYRKNNPPQSIEAKILFDADKADVTGAIGIARTLAYLEGVYSHFYTARGEEIAKQRQAAAVAFYNSMLQEVRESYEMGLKNLSNCLE